MICSRCLRGANAARGLRSEALLSLSRASRVAPAVRLSSTSTASSPAPAFAQARHVTFKRPNFSGVEPRSYSSATTISPSTSAAISPPESPTTLERPSDMTEGEAVVWDILVTEFSPTELFVQDISGGCGSMYGIEITSERFRGLNMVKQQRVVNAALADLVKEWHGVQLRTKVP